MASQLRIVSYNIHKGFSIANRHFLLDEMREGIRQVDADVVFLQEVVGENQRHQERLNDWEPQQLEFLADAVWPHYAYGKNAIYSHGHHGNAILSRYPFNALTNIDVSFVPLSSRGILYGTLNHCMLYGTIHVICLHFGLFAFERRAQLIELCEHINQHIPPTEPLIVAGDFNDWRGHSVSILKKLHLEEAYIQQHQSAAKTFPAFFPLLSMDRIFYRGITLRDTQVLSGNPWNKLSDHCALFAEFQIS